MLANVLGFNGHPVVTLRDDQIIEGSTIEATDLVLASGDLADFSVLKEGTPFLSQTHADLGAILGGPEW